MDAKAEGKLAENVVHFARALRRAGVRLGPGAVVDALDALKATGIGARADFYWTLHAIFVKRREDRDIFDQVFGIFWRKRGLTEKMMALLMPAAPPNAEEKPQKPGAARVARAMGEATRKPKKEERPDIELDARLTLSDEEVLRRKDFEQMSAEEIARAKALIARLVLPRDRVTTRRFRPDRRGLRIDPRATLRRSLRVGGGLIDLARRSPVEKHPPLVAICDISGSMSSYTRMLLHFLHVLGARRRVSTFLFGTRLTNVTRHLKVRDPDDALARVSRAVADWSGGTRIASSLTAFNRDWSRRVLGQGAIVLLCTDGLERDEGDRLAGETERLAKSCRRLIWVNPLLRYERFEAKAAGIKAMLPHIDEFRPVHDLESMEALAAALSDAQAGKVDPRRWLSAG